MILKNISDRLEHDDENRDKVGFEDISLKPKKGILIKKPSSKINQAPTTSARRVSTGSLNKNNNKSEETKEEKSVI